MLPILANNLFCSAKLHYYPTLIVLSFSNTWFCLSYIYRTSVSAGWLAKDSPQGRPGLDFQGTVAVEPNEEAPAPAEGRQLDTVVLPTRAQPSALYSSNGREVLRETSSDVVSEEAVGDHLKVSPWLYFWNHDLPRSPPEDSPCGWPQGVLQHSH